MIKKRALTAAVILTVLSSVLLTGCGGEAVTADPSADASAPEFKTLSEMSGRKIALLTGTIFDQVMDQNENMGKNEYLYFDKDPNSVQALLTGKVDAVALDLPVAQLYASQREELAILPEYMERCQYGIALKKGSPYTERFSEAIRQMREEGRLDAIKQKWIGTDDSIKMLPEQDWEGSETLNCWLCTDMVPMDYVSDRGICGVEPEVILEAAKRVGVNIEFHSVDASGIIPSVATGKADMAAACIIITPERSESMDFTESHYDGATVLLVRSIGGGSQRSFPEKVREGFEKTFLRENRWKLFVSGIGTTVLITVLAAAFGTLLGFAAFLPCRLGGRASNKIADVCIWMIEGMPGIVLLMILYYVVFGKTDIRGTWVAVIAFTLTFGAAVFGLLRTAVGAVDRGQYEAALALGYTDLQAFFKVILPQAAVHFLPGYKSGIIALVKSTAVVGYIAVEDLTRMSDIVRSRTYEAFFPLISSALIYFALAWLLTLVVKHIQIHTDPKRRSRNRILRGVQTR